MDGLLRGSHGRLAGRDCVGAAAAEAPGSAGAPCG